MGVTHSVKAIFSSSPVEVDAQAVKDFAERIGEEVPDWVEKILENYSYIRGLGMSRGLRSTEDHTSVEGTDMWIVKVSDIPDDADAIVFMASY